VKQALVSGVATRSGASASEMVPGETPQIGTISRKTSDSTDKFNGQNPLDIAVANALELLRGQNFEN
jgi:hypothetical protein